MKMAFINYRFKKAISFFMALLVLALSLLSFASCSEGEGLVTTEEADDAAPAVDHIFPTLIIRTDNSQDIVSKDDYIGAEVTVEKAAEQYIMKAAPAQIRGRGNYSWGGMEKKSYRLRFDEKVNLFGQGSDSARSWLLLANHADKSMLRNHTAFKLGRILDNIGFSCSSSFCHLYVNGDYYGVYQVCEQIQIGDGRIDINSDPMVIDTDYLIERDAYAADTGNINETWFNIKAIEYSVKDLDKEPSTMVEKCAFVKNYIQNTTDAIASRNESEIKKYIDIASFVDMYILQELMKNTDVGWSSFFMVKKAGGLLYCTAPWDFDNSTGNDQRLDGGAYEGIYLGDSVGHTEMQQRHEWFYTLMKCRWFVDAVVERWNEVRKDLNQCIYEIDYMSNTYAAEFEKNFVRWPVFDQRINQEPDRNLNIKTYKGQVKSLKQWVKARIEWLDVYFNSPSAYTYVK